MLGVGKDGCGYTIVEALIFLAVSGALLVSAMTIVNGRQERTRFIQSVDEMAQNLEDTLNDVSTGFYPVSQTVRCSVNSTTGVITTIINDATVKQGENPGCVFSGKMLSFSQNSTDYKTYTIVSSASATNFFDKPNELLGFGGNDGVVESKSNLADLQIKKIMVIPPLPATPVQISNPPSLIVASNFSSGGVSLSGNTGRVSLYKYAGLPTDPLVAGTIQTISNNSQVVICLAQGGVSSTSRSAYITITPQLTVERVIGSVGPGC